MQRAIILLLALTLASTAAQAADEIFLLNVPGISGDVTLQGYAGWISVTSFSEAFTNSGARAGSGAGGRVGCQELQIVKLLDVTSPELTMAVAGGHVYHMIQLVALRTAGDAAPVEFLRFTLTNALFTSVAFAGDASASARTETLEVRPTRIDVKYTPQRSDGTPGPAVMTSVQCGSIF